MWSIRFSKNKDALQDLIDKDEKFKHMDPLTANIANDVTNSKFKFSENGKGEIDMCAAAAEMRRESEAIGEARGISIGRNSLLTEMISKGIITPEQAAQF